MGTGTGKILLVGDDADMRGLLTDIDRKILYRKPAEIESRQMQTGITE